MEGGGGADFDGDGKADLVWQNEITGGLALWYMDGPARTGVVFMSPSPVTPLNWKIVGAADFNGDGKPDLVWQNQATGALVLWTMDGPNRTSVTVLNPSPVSGTTWKIVGPR